MGTRSLTFVYDGRWDKKNIEKGNAILCFYRQMDGYPDGHGKELADFLKNFTIINGISGDAKESSHANGAGCLAAQMVKHFKDDVGGIYLRKPTEDHDSGQEYEYRIYVNDQAEPQITMVVGDVLDFKKYATKELFRGDPKDYDAWLEKEKEKADE